MPDDQVPVSLVVSTRDRPDALARCLAAVLAGARLPAEIVIVDQGEQRPAAEVVEALRTSFPALLYLPRPPRGLGAAQNTGVDAATSPWVAVTDDDCLPDPSWLAIIAEVAAGERFDLVTGRVLPAGRTGDRTVPVSSRTDPIAREFRGPAPPWLVGSGNNFAVRRDLYLAIGGCDERLGPGSPALGGVDMDLFYRLLRAGARVRYEPRALVLHERQSAEERRARRPMYGFGMGAAFGLWLRKGDLFALQLMLRWLMLRGGRVARPRDVSRGEALREEMVVLSSTARGLVHGLKLKR